MRILVAEDEPHMARILGHGLSQEGFSVELVDNGEDALHRASEKRYAAIVLDIMLPRRDGYQVCAELREREVWTPILMLTALREELDHAEGLDIGADDYLTKPVSFVVLVAHLRALVRRGRRERPAVLTAGDLRLDPAQRRCWRGGQEVELTARQFSIIEYLMRHPGEVISKTDLLDQVWDPAYAGDVNIVEVYVSRLRQKLDAPFGRDAIRTVRLAGYRLDPDGG